MHYAVQYLLHREFLCCCFFYKTTFITINGWLKAQSASCSCSCGYKADCNRCGILFLWIFNYCADFFPYSMVPVLSVWLVCLYRQLVCVLLSEVAIIKRNYECCSWGLVQILRHLFTSPLSSPQMTRRTSFRRTSTSTWRTRRLRGLLWPSSRSSGSSRKRSKVPSLRADDLSGALTDVGMVLHANQTALSWPENELWGLEWGWRLEVGEVGQGLNNVYVIVCV